MAAALTLLPATQREPPGGRMGADSGCDLRRACPAGRPRGPWGRAPPPRPARASVSEHSLPGGPGWVSPPGDSFKRGRLGWGGPGGETKAGEARHALRRSRWPRGGQGDSSAGDHAIRMSSLRGREGSVQAFSSEETLPSGSGTTASRRHDDCRRRFFFIQWPGRPGRVSAQVPHRSGRADFPHPVPQRMDSLRGRQRR
jgi:hypothetical protein